MYCTSCGTRKPHAAKKPDPLVTWQWVIYAQIAKYLDTDACVRRHRFGVLCLLLSTVLFLDALFWESRYHDGYPYLSCTPSSFVQVLFLWPPRNHRGASGSGLSPIASTAQGWRSQLEPDSFRRIRPLSNFFGITLEQATRTPALRTVWRIES